MTKGNLFLTAAVVGLLSAGTAHSEDAKHAAAPAAKDEAAMGHCVGANACKGQGACKQATKAGKNDCAGKNGCKGKGFLEKTKADCEVMEASNKSIHFVPAKK